MPTEHGVIQGDLSVTDKLIMHGLVTGSIYVRPGGHLDLHGIVSGDVVIEQAGSANLHGVVNGNVRNRGGKVSIYGMIDGKVYEEDGQTFIDRGAVVRNESKP